MYGSCLLYKYQSSYMAAPSLAVFYLTQYEQSSFLLWSSTAQAALLIFLYTSIEERGEC